MEQRISLVTLGVLDLGRARAFYARWAGGMRSSPISERVVPYLPDTSVRVRECSRVAASWVQSDDGAVRLP